MTLSLQANTVISQNMRERGMCMLKLKYLEDNRELVMRLLKAWPYDEESLILLEQYRISSNAVYPYKCQGEVHLLRFSPNVEKAPEIIRAELEYLKFLKENGYAVPEIILSNNGHELEVIDTQWGAYSAAVFKGVKGDRLDGIALTDEIIIGYGRALGELHLLSQKYKPKAYKRISCNEQLDYMCNTMTQMNNEDLILSAIKELRKDLASLTKTQDNYGLIHYDYELDNVFFERESKCYHVIDFDDAVYHYYMMDIVKCIENIMEEHPEMDIEHVESYLLKGYTSVKSIDPVILENTDIFKRYFQIYQYVRCRVSLSEPIDNPPQWMVNVTRHIEKILKEILLMLEKN